MWFIAWWHWEIMQRVGKLKLPKIDSQMPGSETISATTSTNSCALTGRACNPGREEVTDKLYYVPKGNAARC